MSDSLPVPARLRIEAGCARFEEARAAAGPDGAPPRLEDDIGRATAAERPVLVILPDRFACTGYLVALGLLWVMWLLAARLQGESYRAHIHGGGE
jgi:hypothetical protein